MTIKAACAQRGVYDLNTFFVKVTLGDWYPIILVAILGTKVKRF
jgi:hypothetical protein